MKKAALIILVLILTGGVVYASIRKKKKGTTTLFSEGVSSEQQAKRNELLAKIATSEKGQKAEAISKKTDLTKFINNENSLSSINSKFMSPEFIAPPKNLSSKKTEPTPPPAAPAGGGPFAATNKPLTVSEKPIIRIVTADDRQYYATLLKTVYQQPGIIVRDSASRPIDPLTVTVDTMTNEQLIKAFSALEPPDARKELIKQGYLSNNEQVMGV